MKMIIDKTPLAPIILEKPTDYLIELVKPNVAIEIIGLWEIASGEKIDASIKIVHKAANTAAKSVFRMAVGKKASIRLSGTIVIEKNCQNCQSFLEERALLLADSAQAELIPNLEIKTDSVKCSHAASISPPDENAIFYLMSRGLSRDQALQILVNGFLNKT